MRSRAHFHVSVRRLMRPSGRSVCPVRSLTRRQMRRYGGLPAARRPDVLAQMICARVLARSAYSQGARDRQFGAGLTAPSPRRHGSDAYFGAGVCCVRICAAYGLLSRCCRRPGTTGRFPPEGFGWPHRSCLGRPAPGSPRRMQWSDRIPRQMPVLQPTGIHPGTPARPVPPPAQAQRSRQRSRQHQRLLQRSLQRLVSSPVRLPLESVAPGVRRHRQYPLHPRRRPSPRRAMPVFHSPTPAEPSGRPITSRSHGQASMPPTVIAGYCPIRRSLTSGRIPNARTALSLRARPAVQNDGREIDAPMCCQGASGGAGRPVMGHSLRAGSY